MFTSYFTKSKMPLKDICVLYSNRELITISKTNSIQVGNNKV